MIRRVLLAAACIALHGGFSAAWMPARAQPAPADAPSTAFRQALETLPHAATQTVKPVQVVFLNLAALPTTAWQDGQPTPDAIARLMLASAMPPFRPLSLMGSTKEWEAASGIAFADLGTMTAVEQSVTIWRPRDPARIPALQAHLRGLGFTPGQNGLLTAAENTPFNLRMENPWLSMDPGPTSVGRDDDALVQAVNPAAVEAFTAVAPEDSALVDAGTSVALAGMEARLGQGRVVQAALFTPAMSLSLRDPASFLDLHPAKPQRETPGQGMPPYAHGIMADLTGAGAEAEAGVEAPALLISLAYPDCDRAELALARFTAAWNTPPFGGAIPSVLSGKTVRDGQGCAATLMLRQKQPAARNLLLQSILDAQSRRSPTPLDID